MYVSNRKDRLGLYLVKDEYWKQCWLDELLFCIQLTYLHNKIQWVERGACRDWRSEHNLNIQGQHTQHGGWKGKTRIRIASRLFSTDHHSQRSQPLHLRVLMLHHYPIFPSFTLDWFVQKRWQQWKWSCWRNGNNCTRSKRWLSLLPFGSLKIKFYYCHPW